MSSYKRQGGGVRDACQRASRKGLWCEGRRLYAPDGRFEMGNMQDWQHATMYAAFMLSGVVDLTAYYLPKGALPSGLEHVRTPLAAPPPHPPTPGKE